MLIQINTDDHIDGREQVARRVEAQVAEALDRHDDRITRVEIHLSDENSAEKSGAGDKRCVIEARLAGLQPLAASHQASSIDDAVNGAATKLRRLLDSHLGRQKDKSRRESIRPGPEST